MQGRSRKRPATATFPASPGLPAAWPQPASLALLTALAVRRSESLDQASSFGCNTSRAPPDRQDTGNHLCAVPLMHHAPGLWG